MKEDSENAGSVAPVAPVAPAGYRRSAGTPRAQARRRDLLDAVTDDLAAHGLVDFSLRRAAKAAGTTHKVLLYHFEGAEDLLREAVELLRERRLTSSMAAAFAPDQEQTLAGRVRAVWPVLTGSGEGQRALDQALGLAMYDPGRHAALAVDAAGHFLPALRDMCPPQWSERRKDEVAELVFAALRGFLVQRRTGGSEGGGGSDGGGDGNGVGDGDEPGFAALLRMLEHEEAAG
ncbi:putative transcriptional regulator, TetR family [Catenulispora acidiphila DSM 44928]|uniref:Putative transcriptional regulator, TetR family n=1 Tax=Catenulispora acidiphila (strain DSM 44928 / JCM 14897 / NBRC 102108 / NRRL B-24433 / ID139908) TaxID=479433 RepID=C7QFU5_CATAD|nr:TetR family transcriptional regulator [Catenulispora acidiphila]ACU70922.1 putative transcriptional regulator, TetR family [Catenulispora acidiphila DSM 44928]